MFHFTFTLLVGVSWAVVANAQYPPPPTYQSTLRSPVDNEVTVAYKQPSSGTCTTAFATQKQYTGYITLPPSTLASVQQNYPVNTFFWFVEARQSPEIAPLTIWLNGGPGTSSMFGLFNEIGPCEVVQMLDGTYGTQARSFGWDRVSNLLFIDQPNQVGFSYDTLTNASFDLLANAVFEPATMPNSLPKFMYLNGTFGTASNNTSPPYASTANTTEIAAMATWHFLQTWLSTFPQYNPAIRVNTTSFLSKQPAGINLFTESYGGRYGPVFADYFDDMNDAISNGTYSSKTTIPITIQSLGIINGLVDPLVQDKYYPTFAYNNSYGIEAISLTEELNALNNYTNQCVPAISACRSGGADIYGDDPAANAACESANAICDGIVSLAVKNGVYPYDIRQRIPSPDPPAAYQEYLNTASVLQSIGARVNFTESNNYVYEGFWDTGDMSRGHVIRDLANLLKRGVRVALIYGDADYICNWHGGQAISNAIAEALHDFPATSTTSSRSSVTYADAFAAAGYADIVVNSTYVGGAVKQYGNLSFSRIYDAGHFAPYFQPETAFQIFARTIFGDNLSTGTSIDLSSFASTGSANATHKNSAPPMPAQTCWVRSWNASCSLDDTTAMLAGRGLVQNGIYYQDASSIILPSSSIIAGLPGVPISTSISGGTLSSSGLGGVYTATGTPRPSNGAMAFKTSLPATYMLVLAPICMTLLPALLGAALFV